MIDGTREEAGARSFGSCFGGAGAASVEASGVGMSIPTLRAQLTACEHHSIPSYRIMQVVVG
jgi:hypothetical protein